MTIEMRLEYRDNWGNNIFEVMDYQVEENTNNNSEDFAERLDCELNDAAAQWFFKTAKRIYKPEYGDYVEYLEAVDFTTDLNLDEDA